MQFDPAVVDAFCAAHTRFGGPTHPPDALTASS
jgi:hypothetical protein